uniref:Uncharacterized protein n=1 Tax=Chromera velia CCMP2878 TaxID=1169474 RepID=A0A0G4IEN7_9ALVE|eukprot:Cvel_13688.t1-p1 / transcript=Cvel_13688.t1 / gene=Cvel_13688 / organism=Chromera_velia_CCMP2878 / gene_product=hypothetical protein / transcript_product=hypothetical protein / location=Cvel_scaffold945:55087-56558(+) / protein_length=102 / sequence_SO=supercontig / SO=protein_coding / is_pseudo=false
MWGMSGLPRKIPLSVRTRIQETKRLGGRCYFELTRATGPALPASAPRYVLKVFTGRLRDYENPSLRPLVAKVAQPLEFELSGLSAADLKVHIAREGIIPRRR